MSTDFNPDPGRLERAKARLEEGRANMDLGGMTSSPNIQESPRASAPQSQRMEIMQELDRALQDCYAELNELQGKLFPVRIQDDGPMNKEPEPDVQAPLTELNSDLMEMVKRTGHLARMIRLTKNGIDI